MTNAELLLSKIQENPVTISFWEDINKLQSDIVRKNIAFIIKKLTGISVSFGLEVALRDKYFLVHHEKNISEYINELLIQELDLEPL